MKTIQIRNGKTFAVETILWSGMDRGVKVVDKPFELSTQVFSSVEDANKEISARISFQPNLVSLGVKTEIIEGKEYFEPQFNVWD